MSGRTVLVMPLAHPTILLPTGLGAGVAALGIGVAAGVKKFVDCRIVAARREREREKQSNQVWRAFEQEQRKQAKLYEELEQAVQASEKNLASLQLHDAAPQAEQTAPQPEPAHDFAAIGAEHDPAKAERLAAEIESLLAGLPAEFRDTEGSSFPALARQAKRLTEDWRAAGRVRPGEMASFKDLVADTLADFTSERKARESRRQELSERLGRTLEDVMVYDHLLRQHEGLMSQKLGEDLAAVREQVERLVAVDDVLVGQIEVLEKKFADVRTALDNEVVKLAQRDGLCESVGRNLYEMGYKVLSEFGPETGEGVREATFKVPGGERVQISLHENNQLGMQLLHERPKGKRGPLSAKELALVKKQEERWCGDFKDLIRRLVAEGFPYEISVEDKIPDGAVKVVVVETPEDVIAQQNMQYGQDEKRYLDKG